MSTMEYHYQTIGRVLAYLVNAGLARLELTQEDAMNIMTERRGDEVEVLRTFCDVLHWMEAEGLIRVRKIHELNDFDFIFEDVQLTSKGLAVVQAKPDDPAFGESIEKQVSGKGELEASVYTKIGSFVGGVIAGFTQSMSG